ncbi:hypothetical protein OAA91_00385 [Fibrobacterales bacterium]|nr:hypothetical protein [Fibrobacterales bacterium]
MIKKIGLLLGVAWTSLFALEPTSLVGVFGRELPVEELQEWEKGFDKSLSTWLNSYKGTSNAKELLKVSDDETAFCADTECLNYVASKLGMSRVISVYASSVGNDSLQLSVLIHHTPTGLNFKSISSRFGLAYPNIESMDSLDVLPDSKINTSKKLTNLVNEMIPYLEADLKKEVFNKLMSAGSFRSPSEATEFERLKVRALKGNASGTVKNKTGL